MNEEEKLTQKLKTIELKVTNLICANCKRGISNTYMMEVSVRKTKLCLSCFEKLKRPFNLTYGIKVPFPDWLECKQSYNTELELKQ